MKLYALKDAFEFILFLSLAGLSAGVILTSDRPFYSIWVGLLAFVGAGALVFGTFMLPVLIVSSYIIYRENESDPQNLKEEFEESKELEQENLKKILFLPLNVKKRCCIYAGKPLKIEPFYPLYP